MPTQIYDLESDSVMVTVDIDKPTKTAGFETDMAPTQMTALSRTMPWWLAAAIQTTWSTSSSTVLVPSAFGVLGYVLGPLSMLSWIGFAYFVQMKIIDVQLAIDQQGEWNTIADFGYHLGGKKIKKLFSGLTITKQVLFMPCALVFCAHSLRSALYPYANDAGMDCNAYWTLSLIGLAFVVALFGRKFHHAGWLSMITSIMCLVQVSFIAYSVLRSDAPEPMEPTTAWPEKNTQWASLLGNFGVFGYIYVPCFVTTDVMREMKEPGDMKKALSVATFAMVAIYMVVGLVPALHWGRDLTDPITDMLPHDGFGRSANVMLFLASGLDFMLAAITVNLFVERLFFRADGKKTGSFGWALATLPGLAVTVILALLVPNLDTMIGILTATVVPIAQLILPSFLLVTVADKYLNRMEKNALWIASFVGVVYLVFELAATVYDIATADYDGSYFCEISG